MCVSVECGRLTERGVVEREVSQVGGILGQGEETSRQVVPHHAAAAHVLQHSVMDDLRKTAMNYGQEQLAHCSELIKPVLTLLKQNLSGANILTIAWIYWVFG